MIRTQVSFDSAMYRQAKATAARLGISFAELCRRGVARIVREASEGPAYMSLAGSLESGDPEASRSVDEVVYGRERP